MVNDDAAQARTIAGDWHSGQSSALYEFASTGHVADADRLREEVHRCWGEADQQQRAKLGILLRTVERHHITQSTDIKQQLCTVNRGPRGARHAEPGALEADKVRVSADLERARGMEFGVYVAFMSDYGRVLDTLASAYRAPELARAALLRHADQVTDRLNKGEEAMPERAVSAQFEDHCDVPARVATGRAVRTMFSTPYPTLVARVLSGRGQPTRLFEDAVEAVYRHQETFIENTLTHPYDGELLAQADPDPERVDAARAVLAAQHVSGGVVQILADLIHAAEADGIDPHELH